MTESTIDRAADVVAKAGPLESDPVVPRMRKQHSIFVYLSAAWIVLIVLAATFAKVLPIPAYDIPVGIPRQSPQLGSLDLLLGTDTLGRSILSRIIYGAQVSLVVGVLATLAGFVIGSLVGLVGGYFGKRTDAVTSLVADAMLSPR
jgi:peptide/nickel transport system permease protein